MEKCPNGFDFLARVGSNLYVIHPPTWSDEGDPHGVQQNGPAAQVADNGEPGHAGLPTLQAPGRRQLRHLLQVTSNHSYVPVGRW